MQRLNEGELHCVWDFAKETPGGDVDPKWLISMVEEIRERRAENIRLVKLLDFVRDHLNPGNPLRDAIDETLGEKC